MINPKSHAMHQNCRRVFMFLSLDLLRFLTAVVLLYWGSRRAPDAQTIAEHASRLLRARNPPALAL
jgi:hypothetical protein